jgi:hypothetical protein
MALVAVISAMALKVARTNAEVKNFMLSPMGWRIGLIRVKLGDSDLIPIGCPELFQM